MVLVRSERPSAPVETRQSPLDLERGYCIGLEFFDVINAPIQVDKFGPKQKKQFFLQDFSTLTIERPPIEGTSFIAYPSSGDEVVITFRRENEIRELRYGPKGLISSYWQVGDKIIINEHIDDVSSEEERERFRRKGAPLARQSAKRYFFPFASAEIGDDIEEQMLPTGDKYYYHSSYLVDAPLNLGEIHGPISDR